MQNPFADLIPGQQAQAQPRGPTVIGTPRPRQPAAQTPAQATVDQYQAAAAPDQARSAAANATRAELEAASAQRRSQDPAGDASVDQRRMAGFFNRALRANGLYEQQGVGARDLGSQVAQDIAPNVVNYGTSAERQVAEAAMRDWIGATLRYESGAAIPPEEFETQRRTYFPMPGDAPETIRAKEELRRNAIQSLRVGGGQASDALAREYFGESLNGVIANLPPDEPEGRMELFGQFRGEDPQPLVVDVTGGRPPTLEEARNDPEWRAAFVAARRQNPSLTFEQFIGQRQPQSSVPENISDARGEGAELRQRFENAIWQSNPLVGPLVGGIQGTFGPETANAFTRGVIDVPTFGLSDEASAAFNAGIGQGDFNALLERERAINEYDYQNHFGARVGGQVLGGAFLPASRGAGLLRAGGEGAAYGGLYGFGSGEGQDRGRNALIGAGVGGTVGSALRGLGMTLEGTGTRAAARQEVLDAAQRQGIEITRMDAGGVPTRVAAGMAGRTFGAVPMEEGAQRSITSAAAARDRIASDIGHVADNAGAGQGAQRGMRQFLTESMERGNELEGRIPIAPGRPAELGSTRVALQEMTAGFQSNPRLSELMRNADLENYREALESGGLSWADMRAFRSRIGEIIESPQVAGERTTKAQLRRLYGALTEDLQATARAEGPQALNAFQRSQRYWRGRESRREGVISDILGRDFGQGPERAFERINSWAQARGGNFRNVALALRSMPRDEADSVRASIFGRMGQARSGSQNAEGEVFSPAEFVTQWNNLSDRARSFLVPNGAHRAALNDLATVASGMKQSQQFANRSNTGLVATLLATGFGISADPLTTAGLAGASYLTGRFLASPAGARWLSASLRASSPGAIRSQISRLTDLASRNPAIGQEALDLQRILLSAMNDNVPQAGRAAASPEERPRQPNQ